MAFVHAFGPAPASVLLGVPGHSCPSIAPSAPDRGTVGLPGQYQSSACMPFERRTMLRAFSGCPLESSSPLFMSHHVLGAGLLAVL
eukprot:1157292-Pelagomonas_calceolata.AAC.3